jgi:hypothetical protein
LRGFPISPKNLPADFIHFLLGESTDRKNGYGPSGEAMNLPVNKSWISLLHKSISGLDENRQAAIYEAMRTGLCIGYTITLRKIPGQKIDFHRNP